jgi:ubiquinone/menaquinone biosynthesis C-methylase UbiE
MKDFITITEMPGQRASREQLNKLYHRYKFASTFCEGKDVLEVACGAGQGLGYLRSKARQLVGGDYTAKLVQSAKDYYKDRVGILQLDAQYLPFKDNAFDVVILYEAIYYLPRADRFLRECRRLLRDKGTLLICTVNKDWSEFNPSPYSTKYYSVPELYQLIKRLFPKVDLYGSFSTSPNSAREKISALTKRIAVAFHLMPRTMRGKELFKRIFFGKLIPLPNEIKPGMCEYAPAVRIARDTLNRQFKVIYAIGQVG